MFLDTIEAYVEMVRGRCRSERGVRAVAQALSVGSAAVVLGACLALWADMTRSPLILLMAVTGIGIALLAQSVSVILRREARARAGTPASGRDPQAGLTEDVPVPAE